MKNTLLDIDLDVSNILDNMPEGDEHSYIFLRNFNEKTKKTGCINCLGTDLGLSECILSFIEQDSRNLGITLNAVLNYCDRNHEIATQVLNALNNLLNQK